jgi:hypothetical protein
MKRTSMSQVRTRAYVTIGIGALALPLLGFASPSLPGPFEHGGRVAARPAPYDHGGRISGLRAPHEQGGTITALRAPHEHGG